MGVVDVGNVGNDLEFPVVGDEGGAGADTQAAHIGRMEPWAVIRAAQGTGADALDTVLDVGADVQSTGRGVGAAG